jgi:PAS domain S-box-containing protein
MKLLALSRDLPIRRKLTLITVLSVGAALLFAALITMGYQWLQSRAELENTTHSQALIVARNSTSALVFSDTESASQTLEALGVVDNIEFAMLYGAQGNVFATFVPAGRHAPPPLQPPEQELHRFTATHLDEFHPLFFEDEWIGTLHVRSSLTPIYRQMAWSAAAVAAATLGGLGLALLLIASLHPAITGPIARLVGLMDVISREKNYALRADVQGNDELGTLGREFNEMLAQIQARDATLAEHRAHLEQEVAQRTASLIDAQHIAHLGSWEWDIVHDTLSWSDEIYRIFGLIPQQFGATFKAYLQAVHPEDRQLVEDGVREALEEGHPYHLEHRILLPDGTVRYVYARAEEVRSEDGQAIRMVGTVQDITEATLEAEQIRKQQALTTQIIETIPVRVFWKDHDLRYLGCNTLFAKDAGLTHPDELIGKTDSELSWKDQAEIYGADDRLVMDSNTPKLFYDEPQTAPDGGRIWLRTSKVPLRNELNEINGILGAYEDITERKQAAQALEESERKFRGIVDASVDGILVADAQTHQFIIANRAICDMLGYTMDELYRLGAGDIHPAEALAGVQKTFERQRKGEMQIAHDLPVKRKDGSVFFADVSASPIVLEGHTYLVGAFHDVTERRQAEERIRESEARYRSIFEHANDIIFLLDGDGAFTSLSPSFERITGWKAEEWVGKPFAPIVHADDLAEANAAFMRTLEGESIQSFRLRIARKSGIYFDADLSVTPLGRDVVMGVVRDVSERKLAEETVEQLRLDLAVILESAGEGICTMDVNGNHVMVNPSAARMLGYEVDEMIGRHSHSLWHYAIADGTPYPAEDCPIYATTRDGVIRRNEHEVFWRKDGTCFPVEYVATAIWSKGAITGAVVVFHDIAERKQMEEKIRQLNVELESKVQERTQQLLEAQEELVRKERLATLGQVAGSVGHELRNPLGVMNNAVFFLQTVLSDADETTREYLDIIKEEIASSERIVSDLLDSVRTKPPRPEAVGVAELIGQTLLKLTVPATVAVKLDIPPTLSLQVDPQQIRQVFRNLISNGVEAMPEGGTLEIRAVEYKPAEQVAVSVQDTGTGIAPDVLPKLFQPLFTTKARGIGLGLMVVKNLTQANGGEIAVHSEVGRGTTFTVTLPAARSPAGED